MVSVRVRVRVRVFLREAEQCLTTYHGRKVVRHCSASLKKIVIFLHLI
jgi:hypothetical protein